MNESNEKFQHSQVREAAAVEHQLRRLQPRRLQIDDEKIDAALSLKAEQHDRSASLAPVVAAPGWPAPWLALAASWAFGVAVGVVVMALTQSSPPKSATTSVAEADRISTAIDDVASSTTEDETEPPIEASDLPKNSVTALTHESNHRPIFFDRARVAKSSGIGGSLRVGTHILAGASLLEPEAGQRLASAPARGTGIEGLGSTADRDDAMHERSPMSTSRSLLKELLVTENGIPNRGV